MTAVAVHLTVLICGICGTCPSRVGSIAGYGAEMIEGLQWRTSRGYRLVSKAERWVTSYPSASLHFSILIWLEFAVRAFLAREVVERHRLVTRQDIAYSRTLLSLCTGVTKACTVPSTLASGCRTDEERRKGGTIRAEPGAGHRPETDLRGQRILKDKHLAVLLLLFWPILV